MNRTVKLVRLRSLAIAAITTINFTACNNNPNKEEAVAEKPVGEQKLENAISCTKMGIPVVDSAFRLSPMFRSLESLLQDRLPF